MCLRDRQKAKQKPVGKYQYIINQDFKAVSIIQYLSDAISLKNDRVSIKKKCSEVLWTPNDTRHPEGNVSE